MLEIMNTEFAQSLENVKKRHTEAGMKMTYFQMIRELKDYLPEDEHFTSQEEINMLRSFLGLDDMSRFDMQNLRDMIVMMFTQWSSKAREEGNGEEGYAYFTAMMSITCVIDDAMWVKKDDSFKLV